MATSNDDTTDALATIVHEGEIVDDEPSGNVRVLAAFDSQDDRALDDLKRAPRTCPIC